MQWYNLKKETGRMGNSKKKKTRSKEIPGCVKTHTIDIQKWLQIFEEWYEQIK